MAQPFQPNVKNTEGVINVDKLNGYIAMLGELHQWLINKTEYNPDNRYVDSVELTEAITATTLVITDLLKEAAQQLFTVQHKIFTKTQQQ